MHVANITRSQRQKVSKSFNGTSKSFRYCKEKKKKREQNVSEFYTFALFVTVIITLTRLHVVEFDTDVGERRRRRRRRRRDALTRRTAAVSGSSGGGTCTDR